MCKKKKRILSLVLSLLMVLTIAPMPVSAAEMTEPEANEAAAPEDTVEASEQATEEPAAEPVAETTNGLQQPAAGDGTIGNPYQIANADNLYWFAAKVNGTEADGTQNAAVCAKLTDNITVNTSVLNTDGALSGDGSGFRAWTPIGNPSSVFSMYSGIFDGAGHTVKGLYLNTTDDYVGLFGCNRGTIQNVIVADSYFGGTDSVGGVCGLNNSGGSITSCNNSGSVSGAYYVGGVCGTNNGGSIMNCINSGSVSGTSNDVGGVCGSNDSGSIVNCTNSGSASTTSSRVSGVCGENFDTIQNCYYDKEKYTGGDNGVGIAGSDVLGSAEGKTPAEFASGEVTWLLNGSKNPAEGETLAWGQTLSGDKADAYPVLGGAVVYQVDKYESCIVSETSKSGYNNTNEPIFGPHTYGEPVWTWDDGKTSATAEFICTIDSSHMEKVDATVTEDKANHTKTATVSMGGTEYTDTITVATVLTGTGTKEDPYQIGTAEELMAFGDIVNGTNGATQNTAACAILTGDITVNTGVLNEDGTLNSNTTDFQVWTPIGNDTNPYSGTFDGGGHTIKGLYVDTTASYVGLVGYNKGTIHNVIVADSYFKGNEYVGGVSGINSETVMNCTNGGGVNGKTMVGGVSGSNLKTIMNCTNSGGVSGQGWIGGVSGNNGSSGTITSCANSGSVSGSGSSSTVGGVCGLTRKDSVITNCTNSGSVSSTYTAGGVCGENEGTITHGTNSGSVSNAKYAGGVCGYDRYQHITNCYYDNQKCTIGGIMKNDKKGSAEGKTPAAFASGEVTWLLNGQTATPADGETLAWYQNLGENGDPTPVLDSTHGVVYKNEHTNGDATYDNGITYIVAATAKTVDGADVSVNLEGLKVYTKGTKATVTAPVNSGYNFVGWYVKRNETPYYTGNALSTNRTYTFTAEQDIDLVAVYQALGTVELTLGGSYNYTINGTSKSDATTEAYTLGTTITLTTNGDKFAYWTNAAGMILSRKQEYTFTVTGKDTITAEFDSTTGGTIVNFISFYNQVMKRNQWSNAADITIAEAPTRYGYTFKCWSIDGTEYETEDALKEVIAAQIESKAEKLTVTPVYTKETASYTVTVIGGTGSGLYEVNAVASVTANAAEAGMKFANWTDLTGKIVSYNETYQFYVIGDTTLTANFVEEATVVEEKGTTEIVDIVKDTTNNKITFVSMSTVPVGCTILKAGVIATADSDVGTSGDGFNKDTAAIVRGNAWSGNAYRYSWTIKTTKTVYVRAYLEYKDNEGNQIVVYGSMTQDNINE
ncbi:InlB B-repeat-containing protein [Hespellia stercorisuis]|nr:hypothetical protein [Hespellia stercorisuis]